MFTPPRPNTELSPLLPNKPDSCFSAQQKDLCMHKVFFNNGYAIGVNKQILLVLHHGISQ